MRTTTVNRIVHSIQDLLLLRNVEDAIQFLSLYNLEQWLYAIETYKVMHEDKIMESYASLQEFLPDNLITAVFLYTRMNRKDVRTEEEKQAGMQLLVCVGSYLPFAVMIMRKDIPPSPPPLTLV